MNYNKSIVFFISLFLQAAVAGDINKLLVHTGIEDIRTEITQLTESTVKSEVYSKYFSYKELIYARINADVFIGNITEKITKKHMYIFEPKLYKKISSPFFIKFINLINEKIRIYDFQSKLYETNSSVIDERRLKQIKNFMNFFGITKLVELEKQELISKISRLKEKKRTLTISVTNEIDIEIKRLNKLLDIYDERSLSYISQQMKHIRYNEFLQLFNVYNQKELREFSELLISEVYLLMKKASI